jgi:hypothetical protein
MVTLLLILLFTSKYSWSLQLPPKKPKCWKPFLIICKWIMKYNLQLGMISAIWFPLGTVLYMQLATLFSKYPLLWFSWTKLEESIWNKKIYGAELPLQVLL